MSAVSLPAPRDRARIRRSLIFGAIATGLVIFVAFVGSNVYSSLAQRSLRARWQEALADPAAHANPVSGEPVARIRIPGADIDAIVVQGPASPGRAPVHLAATALPGQNGVSAVESGRLGFGGFFAWIDRIAPGDAVAVQGLERTILYRVIDVRRIAKEDIDLTDSGDAAILVLIAPASRLGSGERIVVRAKAEAS